MNTHLLKRTLAAAVGAALLAIATPTILAASASADTPPTVWGCGGIVAPGDIPMLTGQVLTTGGTAPSTISSKTENLVMQADGNLVLFLRNDQGQNGPVLWSSGTWGNPGALAEMQEDGNFVIYRHDNHAAVWSTGTYGNQGACGFLHTNGNFSISRWTGSRWDALVSTGTGSGDQGGVPGPVWSSGSTLRSGQWRVSSTTWMLQQPDGNLVLYRKRDNAPLWSSGTAGRPGSSATMRADGNLAVTDRSGSTLWNTGTSGNPGAHGTVQDDGNFVIYRTDGDPIAQTGTWGRA